MAELRVQAILERTSFDTAISDLEKKINALNGTKIIISVDNGSLSNAATSVAQLNTDAANMATSFTNAANAVGQMGSNAQRAGQQMSQTQTQLRNMAATSRTVSESFTSWASRQIWSSIRREINDTIKSMKEMDAQLTTIKRVAGISDSEAQRYQEQAFEVGKKYGVKPQDYLANVVEFTRAGYADLAPGLGELATKMQLVGEVSQSTAAQMLLSTDAAYKYDGSVEKLNAVLDGVTVIGDKNATSMEKVAQGIGLVAPIAAQAHVGIDELTAAIGTITAVTQRSGSEAARALRAVFLNIIGDTKTEVEDGATFTVDEINGLRDILNLYAKDAVEAAEKTGDVINPMKAIEGLSKSLKEGVLTESELMQMVTDIGGKLRASSLMALISNWDKYSAMLQQFGDAAGAADAKIDVALSGWDAKANQLSNSFTKLFNDVLNGSTIKGGLDVLTKFVDLLDIGDGVPARIAATAAAVSVLVAAFNGLKSSTKIQTLLSFLTSPTTLIAGGIAAAVVGGVELINYLNGAQDRREQAAQEADETYRQEKSSLMSITEELNKQQSLYDSLKNKANRSSEENATLAVLEQQTAELRMQQAIAEKNTKAAQKDAAEKAAAAYFGNGLYESEGQFSSTAQMFTGYANALSVRDQQMADRAQAAKEGNESAYATLTEQISRTNTVLDGYEQQVVQYYDKQTQLYNTVKDYYEEAGLENATYELLSWSDQQVVDVVKNYQELQKRYAELLNVATGGEGGGTAAGGGAAGEAVSSESAFVQSRRQHEAQVKALNQAIREYNKDLRISKDTYRDLTLAGYDLSEATLEDGDAYVISRKALESMTAAAKQWYEDYGIEMPENFEDIASSSSSAADGFNSLIEKAKSMAAEANAASAALANLKSKLKDSGEVGDAFGEYKSEYAKAMALYEKGFIGSREFQGFAQLLLGDDVMASIGYDFEKAGQLMGGKFIRAMFEGDSDDFGQNALEYLVDNVGDVRNEAGELIASFTRGEDGLLNGVINDFDALAKQLGISKDALMTLVDAWGIYSGELNTTDKKMIDLLDGMGSGVEKLADGTRNVDLQKFINNLALSGKDSAEIFQLVQRLQGMEGINILGDKKGTDLASMIQEMVKAAHSLTGEVGLDGVDETATKLQEISDLQEQINSAQSTVKVALDAPKEDQLQTLFDLANQLGLMDEHGKVALDMEGVEGSEEKLATLVPLLQQFGLLDETAVANLDSSDAETKEAALQSVIDALQRFGLIYTASARLDLNYDDVQASYDAAVAIVEMFNSEEGQALLSADDGELQAVYNAAKAIVDSFDTEEGQAQLTADDGAASDTVADAIKLLQGYAKTPADAKLTATDVAKSVIDGVKKNLESIPKSVTTTINVRTSVGSGVHNSSSGSEHGGGVGTRFGTAFDGMPQLPNSPWGFSTGTRDYPGGKSVVNEKGPELISANGRAFIANNGAPTIVDLPKGAVIFNAEETRHITAGKGIPPAGIYGNYEAPWDPLGSDKGGSDLGLPEGFGVTIRSKRSPKKKGGGGGGTPVDNTDYWAIIEAHYKDITETADNAVDNLKYQIEILKNAWDDEKEPLDDQIDALKELNDLIDRQITLLERERDKLTDPLQDEIDALNAAKDIQDDQLELAERQKAVEEARAELQNAQNERTIRFFNKETGHWEWMADQERIRKAQEALENAQKSLSDFEYDLHIKDLERQIDDIESDYQSKIDALEQDVTDNEDTIYDLNQQLKELQRKYDALINPLEDEQEDRERSIAAAENAWANILFARREGVEGDLANAIAHEGETGAQAGNTINEMKADLDVIAKAYASSQKNNTLASLGIQFGATPTGSAGGTTNVAGSMTDSHNQTIIINGITLPASAAYKSLMEIAGDLAIYAGN